MHHPSSNLVKVPINRKFHFKCGCKTISFCLSILFFMILLNAIIYIILRDPFEFTIHHMQDIADISATKTHIINNTKTMHTESTVYLNDIDVLKYKKTNYTFICTFDPINTKTRIMS
eukprot:19010_1